MEREILERLHSAKPTGGSIRNIWVWGGQGGFCLQAVHWPDTSPRFSLGFYMRGGRNCWGLRSGGCLLFCRQNLSLPRPRIYTEGTHIIVFVRKFILYLDKNN